jgi:hypothetical protein
VLKEHFDILRVFTTRNPVAQWQSLVRLNVMQQPIRSGQFTPEHFFAGYRKYAELCVEIGFVRYEDFVRRPDMQMRKLCGQLQINFDPTFATKWANYQTITGDTGNSQKRNKIKASPNESVEPALRTRFLANADYHRVCKLLGYDIISK